MKMRLFCQLVRYAVLVVILGGGLFASPASAGTGTAGDPYTSLTEAYSAPASGRYFFNLGSGTFEADVDVSEGGGWVLVLQYVHAANTNPPLTVLGAGANLPVTSTAALGTDESAIAARWGHAGNAAMSQFTGDIETRWFGRSANSLRRIHFRTSIGDDYFRTGIGSMVGVDPAFTNLTSGNGTLPRFANNYASNQGNFAFTNFPFFRNDQFHWGIRGAALGADPVANGNRWESDDFANGSQFATIHRVWVRNAVPGTVTTTGDSGTGSLRDAITYANTKSGADTISFAIPGAGPHTITLSSGLPDLTDAGTSIDARTQPGTSCGNLWAGTPPVLRVWLNGPTSFAGLTFAGANQALRGLSITGFSDRIETASGSTNATIQCNFLGLAPDGSTSVSSGNGVRVRGTSARIGGLNTGEGNVISSNFVGVLTMANSADTSVQGNFIGTDPTGMLARSNQRAVNNQNGTATWRDITWNLISANTVAGILLETDDQISASNGQITIQRNRIGFTRTLNGFLRNGNFGGIFFAANTINNVLIGGDMASNGNVITGSETGVAVDIATANNITIQGNTIAHAGSRGILLTGVTNSTIGGTIAGQGNIIGGNGRDAIEVRTGSSIVSILGNTLGTVSLAGITAGNVGNGIRLETVSNITIGNGLASGRNIIGGNGWRGIDVNGTVANITINGNYIGTDASGNVAVTNGGNLLQAFRDAISLDDGVNANNVIISNNVIGGYSGAMLEFISSTVNGLTIQGNNIGIGADGASQIVPATQEDMILFSGSPVAFSNVLIGGSAAEQGNRIAFGGRSGIGINSGGSNIQVIGNTIRNHANNGIYVNAATSVAIVGNAIFNNGGLGIDLNNDGVTANDADDDDTGPNDLLNFPQNIRAIVRGPNTLGYSFTLDAPAAANSYRVEFFANDAADPSGYGEGQRYLGHVDISHGGGAQSYTGTLATLQPIAIGSIISATATRGTTDGSWDITSEFSAVATAEGVAQLTVEITSAPLEASNPNAFATPGNDILLTTTVTNTGNGGSDPDSLFAVIVISESTSFFNGSTPGLGDVIGFSSGSPTLTFTNATDLRFSNNAVRPGSMAECNYTPASGYDPEVRYVCLNPKGTLPPGAPAGQFSAGMVVRIN